MKKFRVEFNTTGYYNRAYRRKLEAMQAEEKNVKEGSKACIYSYFKNNFRKK